MNASPRRLVVLVCVLVGLLAVPLVSAAAPGGRGRPVPAAPVHADAGAYMLQATGRAAAAEYRAARRGGASRAEAARGARARRQANSRKHDEIVAALGARGLGRRVLYRVGSAYNGVAVHARRAEVAALRAIPGVQDVLPIPRLELDNAVGAPWIGAPAVWEGVPGETGEGMSIGIVDTGVDYVHTDFGGSGDAADLEAARAPGANLPGPTPPSFSVSGQGGQQLYPSAKVVGGYDFAGDGYHSVNSPVPAPDPNPMGCTGHGSHVAGTAAGLGVEADGSTYAGPYDSTTPFGSMRIGPGIAPEADIYALRVFGCSGPTDLTPQALDWAVDPDGNGDPTDHLDVVNLSLGSAYGSPDDLLGLVTDQAVEAGVIVVGSAGNSGDSTYITGGPGAARRAISVASANSDAVGVAPTALEVTEPATVAGLYGALEGNQFNNPGVLPVSGALVRPGDFVGCAGFDAADAALIQGAIPILDRFSGGSSPCGTTQRANNVMNAGGVGVVFIDPPNPFFSGPPIAGNELTPSLLIQDVAGDVLLDALSDGPVQVRISRDHLNEVSVRNADWGDVGSSFSSRGPASTGGGLKPDITAPGSSVVSVEAFTGNASGIKAGTSMAAPHVAGAMALLRAKHPSWSVAELKALAMNTAAHDVRFTTGGAEVLSPVRQGAGRVDLANGTSAGMIAFDDDAPGEVGVSFGALKVADTLAVERTVRVVDKGGSGGTFDVSYVPATEVPGVSYSFPDGPTVTVAPGGEQTFRVRLSGDAALMDGTVDPNHTQADRARDALAEASGSIRLTPAAGSPLRVPVHASLRPASDMSAAESALTFDAPQDSTELHLEGTPVDSGDELPRDLVSLVTPFELQGESPPLADVREIDRPADLHYVGVASDARRRLAANEEFGPSRVWFGLSTRGRWSSPMTVDLVVQVDADLDGTYEAELRNGSDGTDIFYTGIKFPEFNVGPFEVDALNGLYPGVANTAVFDTDTIVLSGFAEGLGLAPGERFRYRVQTWSRFSTDMIDSAGPFTYDPSAPGLDINGTGIGGLLTTRDLPGETLDVAYDQAAYEEDGALGALLLHHYNGDGARAEVVPLNTDGAAPTSAISYPAASANILASAFADGCATAAEDVCGTASDDAGGTGVEKVEVQLKRASDEQYYDGAGWVAAATWIDADGTTEWTRAFPATPGNYTIASRATDLASNVETPGAPRAFRILPTIVDAGVLYTGDQSVVQGSTLTLSATLSSSETLVCALGGKTLSFSLDDDPTTAAVGDGPYALGTASTNGSGVATTSRSTSGWISGVYTVSVSLAAGGGCTAAADDATLTIASAGDAATGGGWYTLAGSGRVNFGFTVHKVSGTTSTYKGQVLLINNGKWRYKGTLTKYVKPTATTGSADGRGTLYRWDATTAVWVVHATDVALNIRFTDNQKQKRVADLFGARIAATAPLALPNSEPVAIKGGDVNVR